MTAPFELFASCSPGLEPLLEAELSELGALQPKATAGGVRFRGHRRLIYRVNLESGLATHVRLRVARFTARYFDTLEQHLAGIDWTRYLAPGVARKYRVTARKSRLHHTGAIEERADAAITCALWWGGRTRWRLDLAPLAEAGLIDDGEVDPRDQG